MKQKTDIKCFVQVIMFSNFLVLILHMFELYLKFEKFGFLLNENVNVVLYRKKFLALKVS